MKYHRFLIRVVILYWLVVLASCNNAGPAIKLQEPVSTMTKDEKYSENQFSDKSDTLKSTADARKRLTADLLTAYRGEITASARYSAFSTKAEQEGFYQIALLFKAASMSEKIHAGNHKAVLDVSGAEVAQVNPIFTVKSTRENLQDAISGERYGATTMYPGFLKDAEVAGNHLAFLSLNYAMKTEIEHRLLYEIALAAMGKKSVASLSSTYYVCPVCGSVYEEVTSPRCGICMSASEKFIKINRV